MLDARVICNRQQSIAIPYVIVECPNKHRWPLILAGWWFNVRDIQCPKCDKKAVSMKWGGMAENLKDGVLIEQTDGSKE